MAGIPNSRILVVCAPTPGWHDSCNKEPRPARPAMKGLHMKTLIRRQVRKGAARFALNATDRDPTNPLHWMPVSFPGLTEPQFTALMQEVDRRPYTPPCWLRMPRPESRFDSLQAGASDFDRDPNNPLHWMPVPPPVISREQIEAKAEAIALI